MPFTFPEYGSFSTILVAGAAKSGLSATRFLLSKGAERVILADSKPADALPDARELASRDSRVVLHAGGHPADLADEVDLLVVSPGVPLAHPLFARARELGRPVVGEIELAHPFLSAKRIGITGSNGKSTTTALVAEMARQAGLRAAAAGNFGRPVTDLIDEPLDLVAIELSSFQLEGIERFRTDAAILLNVTPDHMDRYPSVSAYGEAKRRIFGAQREDDVAVVSVDDAFVAGTAVRGRRFEFSRAREVTRGAFVRGDQIVFRGEDGVEEIVAQASRIRIPGAHNLENALAAVAATRAIGLPSVALRSALESFAGLPHRCEPIGEIRGLLFVNDSKGTNVDSTIQAFAAYEHRKTWLVLGGRDKAGDFTPLESRVRASRNSHAVLTVGEAGPKIGRLLASAATVIDCGTIEKAVDVALEKGRGGDVVLLSPACASFDQFRNYEHRGEEFRRIVRERMTSKFRGEGA